MKKLLFACCLALGLIACGGGGEPTQLANSVQTAATALKARAAAPDANLVAQAVYVVNTTTAGDQLFRTIGALANGGYTVAWVSNGTLFFQRYGAAGAKVGGESTIPLDVGENFSVAVLGDGGFVVAYLASVLQPNGFEHSAVVIRRFDANGVQVNADTEVVSRDQVIWSRSPYFAQVKVLALADGGFVVGWADIHPSSVDVTNTVYSRRYDRQGQPLGNAVVAGGPLFGLSYSFAADDGGGYTVSMVAPSSQTPFIPLRWVVHYGSDGIAQQIVAAPTGDVLVLPLAGDGFVLFTSDSSGSFRQLLDSAGNPVGDPIPVAMPFEARELADGGFVVFWSTAGIITVQRHDSTGAPLGDVLTIATDGPAPGVTALNDGGFALAWSARTLAGDFDVYTQAFLELPGSDRAVLRFKRKACLESARGMVGQERKAFMDACLAWSGPV